MAMNHRRYIAWFRSIAQVIFVTYPERHIGRSLRFCWGVLRTDLGGVEGWTFWDIFLE